MSLEECGDVVYYFTNFLRISSVIPTLSRRKRNKGQVYFVSILSLCFVVLLMEVECLPLGDPPLGISITFTASTIFSQTKWKIPGSFRTCPKGRGPAKDQAQATVVKQIPGNVDFYPFLSKYSFTSFTKFLNKGSAS